MDVRRTGRILYVSSVDISLGNGPGVNEREFTFALLKELGPRATVLVPRPTRPMPALPKGFVLSRGYQHVGHPSFWLDQLSQRRLASAILRSGNVDLLVYRLALFPVAQWSIARRGSPPHVVKTLGSGVIDALGASGGASRFLGPLNELLVRRIAAAAVVVDACTPELGPYLEKRLGIRGRSVRLVENATNTTRFKPTDLIAARARLGLAALDPIIGYVGGSPWERGGRQLIEIARLLRGRFPRLGVVVVGGDGDVSRLRAHADQLGVADRCVFTGQVPYDDVAEHINAFDIGFSLDLPERMARIGNSSQKVRQYVACGKPVIAGPVGSDFLVEHRLGSVVEADDIGALGRAVESWLALSGPERADHRAKASAYARANLSVESILAERLAMWSEVLAGTSSSGSGFWASPT